MEEVPLWDKHQHLKALPIHLHPQLNTEGGRQVVLNIQGLEYLEALWM